MARGAQPIRLPQKLRWYHVVLPLLAIVLPLALLRLGQQPAAIRLEGEQWVADKGEYAGATACRDCHGAIVDQQLASSHAQTIRDLARESPRAPVDSNQPVTDPLTGARYSVRKTSGGAEIAVDVGGTTAAQKLQYEFGSGTHAYGYLFRGADQTWVDARLNYYQKVHSWGFTSTQDKPERHLLSQPLGRPQQPAAVARCFSCHSTVVRADGLEASSPDGAGLRVRPDRSTLNITCEACHGPRAQHARERRSAASASEPSHMSADQINVLCGRCHGLSNIDQAHPVIARFQPWGLARSRCFLASGGKLSCLSCHDPHTNARRDAAFYEAKCLSCHTQSQTSAEKVTTCPVNQKTGCVSCHMPSDSKSMKHVTFVDHRIRVVTQQQGAR